MKQQFVVIGLGRFGSAVSRTLAEMGESVIGIDKNPRKVQDLADVLQYVYEGDSTDEHVLKELGVHHADHAVVAIGDDLQASVLTTLILKDIGVPTVTAKAASEYHRRVLERIGADHIVQPERDTGVRVARQLVNKNMVDYLELSPEFSLVEVVAPKETHGKSLKQLNVRAKYGCNIVAIRHKDNGMNVSPLADDVIREGDVLVMIGSNEHITRFEKRFEE